MPKTAKAGKNSKNDTPRLPSGLRLFRNSLALLWRYKRLFGSIFLVYLGLSLVFVKGNSQPSSNAEVEVIRTYQMILLVIVSLAVIWALRQTTAKKSQQVGLRDSFYKGMHPLIPFQLVLAVILLQLTPVAIASYLYQQIFNSTLVTTPLEQTLWAIVIGVLCLLSLYLLASSIFALYVVTLPNTWPVAALRSARELVRFRRWVVIRKLLFLLVAGLLIVGLLLVPWLVLAPVLADWIGFLLSLFAVFVVHSYIYQLYKELLA